VLTGSFVEVVSVGMTQLMVGVQAGFLSSFLFSPAFFLVLIPNVQPWYGVS
jgi:hypothetical protein